MKRALQLFSSLAITFGLCHCESKSSLDTYTEKKILVIGNSNEPSGLDPHMVTGVLESNILRALFEGLCLEDPLNGSKSKPGSAASWTSNEDFTEWVFKLQPDGKWSDGKPVTADDYVFSYHRILSPSLGAKYASMLHYIEGAEEYNKKHNEIYLIKNSDEFKDEWETLNGINFRGDESIKKKQFEGTDFTDLTQDNQKKYIQAYGLNKLSEDILNAIKKDSSLFSWPEEVNSASRVAILAKYISNEGEDLWNLANVGVIAIDDYTLKIKLKVPVPFLPDLTKHYTWFAVPKHVILKHGKISVPNTKWTDPENLVSNGPFRLKTWKFNYKIEAERNPHYWDLDALKLNGIVFLPISNAYTETRMFYNDQLHITYALPSEMIEYSEKNYPQYIRQETYLGTDFIRFNNTQEELTDINLRKAFAYAIDSKSLIKYVLKGGEKVATGITPPMGEYQAVNATEYNPEKAKEYFAKTKFANNPQDLKVVLLTVQKDSAKTLAEALHSMWSKTLGVEVKIEQREWTSYQDSMSNLDYGIVTGGWVGDYPDPTTFLDMWKKGDGNNRTGWSSEAFEAKLKEAAITKDPLGRLKTLHEAESIMMKDMPIAPICWKTSNYLVHKSVKNWNPMIMKNQPYKFIDLEN
jgi:oligopeptide transport system substrate-binding protein